MVNIFSSVKTCFVDNIMSQLVFDLSCSNLHITSFNLSVVHAECERELSEDLKIALELTGMFASVCFLNFLMAHDFLSRVTTILLGNKLKRMKNNSGFISLHIIILVANVTRLHSYPLFFIQCCYFEIY